MTATPDGLESGRFCPACGAAAPADARFCPSCGALLSASEPAATPPPQSFPAVTDELRPVTALFADVVGSTALGERLGPEEVKALIGECVTRMSRAVEEYGGTVQAYMGDGICAYYGVPIAHEDDPERAARAALRILEVVGEYATDIAGAWGIADFNVRVGINSGQTAVGLVGAADKQAVALGDATNVAARLQAAAEPGTIAVGESTARRLWHRFVLEPVGEETVKGRTGPVSVWRLLRAETRERVFASTPLVGRDAELERLHTAVEELSAGRGQILFLSAEAGMGKTRLLGEMQAIAEAKATWLQGNCLSYGGLLSWPFVEMLRDWLGVEDGEAEIAIRTKARARLGALFGADLAALLPPLGRLLRIRLDPERDEGSVPTPPAGGEIARGYVAWVEALTRQRPVVVALEDVHWADSSSRELAEALLELTDRAPLLLVATFRPDPTSEGGALRLKALADFAHRTSELQLAPLSEDAARRLLTMLMPAGLEESAREEIVSRAEGNPLYLEELLRVLVEGGTLERQRAWTVTMLSAAQLSPALQTLLVSRIDNLPAGARRVAQMAAVIGRSFPLEVLERIADAKELSVDVTALLRAEVIRELRRYPEPEYVFKHGLYQQAALSTLTGPSKDELYARVAATFELLYSEVLDDHAERLAHYYAQARNLPKALEYLERAAAKAVQLDAPSQAVELWKRAQKLAAKHGDADAEQRAADRLAELELSARTT